MTTQFEMAKECSLYLHIPYCPSICPYCDFNVVRASKVPWERFVAALHAELTTRHAWLLLGVAWQSIYFGGGTPSLMPPEMGEKLLQDIAALGCGLPKEVTLEAEPNTLEQRQLEAWRTAGINRMSMGWQATQGKVLRRLGRGHTSEDARRLFAMGQEISGLRCSADLIYGVPGQSLADAVASAGHVLAQGAQHISLYSLTVYPKTPFGRAVAKGKMEVLSDDAELIQMRALRDVLQAGGLEGYEVSNFAAKGHASQHNQSSWRGISYLGIGPGAHSFLTLPQTSSQGAGLYRWENLRDPDAYIHFWLEEMPASVAQRVAVAQKAFWEQGKMLGVSMQESVSELEHAGELLLCGLRLAEGVGLKKVLSHAKALDLFWQRFAWAVDAGWLIQDDAHCIPTWAGRERADALAPWLWAGLQETSQSG